MNKKHIFNDVDAVCKSAADYIVALSKKTISKKGKFTIALSGGNTPRKLYELMAQSFYANAFDWKNIFIFWSDERCVPATDENNNSNMAFNSLLNKIQIPAENIFPIPVNFEPAKAASVYEQNLQAFFKEELPVFDLILLGLGDNGHTASLFPYTPILSEKKHIVKEVFIEDLNVYRISFTSKLINNASHILFLVTGEAKAEIVKIIFSKTNDTQKYPVLLINPLNANPDWFLDQAAASKLKIKK
ncbi:MAG: 6-phosphogluconolactonase [Ferruginibacter sp.]